MFNIFRSSAKEPIPFGFKTDIHCHVIPGIDDGAFDAANGADLIERMQRWGIERIFASPHVTQYSFENSLETITPALEELRTELATRNNNISINHSAEYRLDDLFNEHLATKQLMTLPNDFLLIENSFVQEAWNLEQLVFELQVKGFRPILVHPERYLYYNSKKNRYSELHRTGLLFQINILSLTGAYGKDERKLAEYLLKEGMVNFAGTDLHRLNQADVIDKYLTTSDARAHMADLAACVMNDKAFIVES